MPSGGAACAQTETSDETRAEPTYAHGLEPEEQS